MLLDGTRIKTVPSRLGAAELARLAANGARPAGPSPLPAGDRAVIEVDRTVNATGGVSLADQQVGVGSPLAGQRVTMRMEGPLMAVLAHDGTLLRTMACPIPANRRSRLRGVRRARSLPPQPGGPITVQRRVSSRGGLMVARQKIHAGMIHAGKTATVICETTSSGWSSTAKPPPWRPAPPPAKSTVTKPTPPINALWPGSPRKDSDPHT